jgi:RNA polymerase sigma-70 factor (ECF subfamily)
MDQRQRSVEQMYRSYFAIIRAKCTRMLGDTHEAEDVAQETFVRLWRDTTLGVDPHRVSAWIYRTSTRLAIDHLRGRRHRRGESAGETVDHASPEALVVARRALGQLVLSLAPEELEVAVLSRLDGLGQREIAEVLNRSERTVRRVLSRLEARLLDLPEVAP